MKNEKEESYRKGLQDAYKDILKLIYRDGYTAERLQNMALLTY